jgi:hypothetical protein
LPVYFQKDPKQFGQQKADCVNGLRDGHMNGQGLRYGKNQCQCGTELKQKNVLSVNYSFFYKYQIKLFFFVFKKLNYKH